MIELTEEQRQELSEAQPVAIDPRTRQVYVLAVQRYEVLTKGS
jgi:hypothetical protein